MGSILDPDAILRLSESASYAAIDPSHWSNLIVEAGHVFGAAAFTVELANKKTGAVRLESSLQVDQKYVDLYEGGIFHCNPRVALAVHSRTGALCHDGMISAEQWARSGDYIDWLKLVGTRHFCGVKLCDSPTEVGFFSMQFEEKHGPPDAAILEAAQQISPYFQNALAVTRALAAGGHWQSVPEIADEGTGGAYALLSPDGRVARLSSSMEAILCRNDVLGYRNQQLVAISPIEHAALQRFVAQASLRQTGMGPPSPLRLRGAGREHGIILRAVPLGVVGDVFDVIRPSALIVAVDLDAPLAVKLSTLRSVWGLTAREAELALLIAGGRSVEQSAHRLGISNLTARHHLKSIFRRMEIERQADLVRLITKLG